MRRWIALVLLAAAGVSTALPFFWMITSALKTREEYVATPPVLWPASPQWANFSELFALVPFGRYYTNSFIVAGGVTLTVLISSSLAGFALAKFKFPGREFLFRGILATLMLPNFIFYIPVYYMLRHWPLAGGNDLFGAGGVGLLRSHWAMILPFAVSAWGIFLFRQFAMGIPDELLDAARVDGCSDFMIFWRILLPLAKPALATIGIFTFVSQWNNLFWPLIISTSTPELMTLPVGLKLLEMAFDPKRNQQLIMAGIAVGIIPASIVFLVLQKYYVRGMVMSGIKA